MIELTLLIVGVNRQGLLVLVQRFIEVTLLMGNQTQPVQCTTVARKQAQCVLKDAEGLVVTLLRQQR